MSKFLPFDEALAVSQSLGLANQKEWYAWGKEGMRPANVPGGPHKVYKHDGWQGWGHWLGTGNIKSGDGADQDQEKTQPGTATTPGAEGSLAAIKTKGGKKGRGPKTPKTPKSGSLRSHAVAAAAKLAALAAAHKRKALPGVTPALANAPDPAAKVGLSPGLVPMLRRGLLGLGSGLLAGVEPVRPRGKTLTLEEYKVRQGIE